MTPREITTGCLSLVLGGPWRRLAVGLLLLTSMFLPPNHACSPVVPPAILIGCVLVALSFVEDFDAPADPKHTAMPRSQTLGGVKTFQTVSLSCSYCGNPKKGARCESCGAC